MSEGSTGASVVPATVHLPDDRYIPVRTEDLVAALAREHDAFGELAPRLAHVGEALTRIVSAESGAFSRRIERAYAPFNPDRETVTVGDVGGDRAELAAILAYTFDKANYDLLEDTQVRAAIDSANVHGMKVRVDREKVEELQIFVRGRTQETRLVRTIRRPIVGEMREVELYRRLAVVFRMQNSVEVNIKLFRDIPVADLEALLPHAEAGMSNLDRIKILGGGIGAIGGATWKAAALLVSGTVIAGQYFWALIAGLVGLSVRSVLGYRRAKHLRSSQRTHHLYYQNIANNAGVLDLLVTSIGHEELKETLLAYALLLARGERIDGADALSRAVEAWIARRFHVTLDFDVADALESLDRLGLWADRATMRPLEPEPACARLEQHWRERTTEDYHARTLSQRG
ncbi:MAG: DUF3754 domain-containing protein [Deltaproteobacteria bacterium]|nr:DUF3754 domain-containing protein [Nannocystaceae bacterium]